MKDPTGAVENSRHGSAVLRVRALVWASLGAGLLVLLAGRAGTHAQEAPAVILSELMWGGEEYIELRNLTAAEVPLAGWSLERKQAGKIPVTIVASAGSTAFQSADRIPAGGFFLIVRSAVSTATPADKTVSFRLVDAGELVTLRDASGAAVDAANREGPWFTGTKTASMERKDPPGDGTDPGRWHASTGVDGARRGTPGAANSPGNRPPTITLTLPGSLTERASGAFTVEVGDPDGDAVTVSWDFGDGGTGAGVSLTHAYARAGTYTVIATVTDGVEEQNAQGSVAVTPLPPPAGVVVNEALPNPIGSDVESEFLELFNTTGSTVDLGGAQLDDADGGSSPYTIPDGTTIGPGAYLSFLRSETGLALNNDGDRARLLAPDGALISELVFGASPREGASWVRRDDGGADWTMTPTPGAANVFTPLPAAEPEGEEPTPRPTRAPAPQVLSVARALSTPPVLPVAEVRKLPVGSRVRTVGVVAAPPGVLGRGVFYLAGPVPEPPALFRAGSGLQVFVTGGDQLPLALGDRVAVTGTISAIQNELRIRAKVADVQRVGAGAPPEPTKISTGRLGESREGALVRVRGSISRLSGNTFELDDGSGPARVLVKKATGWTRPALTRGQRLSVIGIVSQSDERYRVLPRFPADLVLEGAVAGAAILEASSVESAPSVESPARAARPRVTRPAETESAPEAKGTPAVEAPEILSPPGQPSVPVARLPLPTILAWSAAGVFGVVRMFQAAAAAPRKTRVPARHAGLF